MDQLHHLMLQGSPTPLEYIYGYWVILLKAAMEDVAFANFLFTTMDDMAFTYKGSPGTVDGLRDMIHHHINEAD